MTETKDKTSEGPGPRKPDFGNAPAEQERARQAAAQQAEADKREADEKKTKSGPSSKEAHEGEAKPFKATKEQPDENPAASAQMTAEYGEIERDFSDGVEVEPEIEHREHRKGSTTVKQKGR